MIASPFEPVRRSGPRRVGIVIYPDAQGMDVSGPYEVFAMASNVLRRMARTDVYELYLIAETLEPIRMTSGARLCPDVRFDDCPGPLDTLIVPGSEQIERAQHDPAVLRLLRERGDDVRRLVSICTGAFFLAALGLLDGRRATTHWSFCQLLQRSFGEVEVVPDALYIKEGRIYTSAGITAGMDLALTLVEEDHGRQVAMAVARSMVLFYRRPGGQSQFSEIIESQASTHFGALIDWNHAEPPRRAHGGDARAPGAHEPAQLHPPVHARARADAGQVHREAAARARPRAARQPQALAEGDRGPLRVPQRGADAPRLPARAPRDAARVPRALRDRLTSRPRRRALGDLRTKWP